MLFFFVFENLCKKSERRVKLCEIKIFLSLFRVFDKKNSSSGFCCFIVSATVYSVVEERINYIGFVVMFLCNSVENNLDISRMNQTLFRACISCLFRQNLFSLPICRNHPSIFSKKKSNQSINRSSYSTN